MSVNDSLNFIANIKGVPHEEVEFQKDFIMDTLDLKDFKDTLSGQLSGGNKRKLVCALSLLASP